MSRTRRNGPRRKFLQSPYKKREEASQQLTMCAFICDQKGIDEAIKDGADVDTKDVSGLTPLLLLLHHNQRKNYKDLLASIGLLLEANADVNIPDRIGRTACHLVCSNNHINKYDRFAVLKLIVDFKPTNVFFNQTEFSSSWEDRYSKVSSKVPLIPRRVISQPPGSIHSRNVHSEMNLSIHTANSEGLPSDEAKGSTRMFKLRHAESSENVMSRTLPKKSKSKKPSKLFSKWRRNNSGSNITSVKIGCDITQEDSGGRTPMHDAAQRGFSDCVSFLIQSKADINAKARNGQTPLHRATTGFHTSCISVLINWGCHLNAQDKYGNTVLHLVAKSAENRKEKLFINKTLEIIDCFLRLDQATLESRTDIIQEALDNCVDAFDSENEKQTSLVQLIAEMAVEPFVDSRLKNSDGLTAYGIAARLANKKRCSIKIAKALIPAR